MYGNSRPTLLGRRLCDGTDAGSGRSLRAALLLLLLAHFSRLFLLPFDLTVITLGQRTPPMLVPLNRHVVEHSTPLVGVGARKLRRDEAVRHEVCYVSYDR